MNHDDYSFRGRYPHVPPYTPHPYQSTFYGDPGGTFYDPLNNFHGPQSARPLNFRGRNPTSFGRPPSRPAQPYVGALDLQGELQNRMSPADEHVEFYHPSRPQQQERDPGFNKKRKFAGRLDHTIPKRNAIIPNRGDAHSRYTVPATAPTTVPTLTVPLTPSSSQPNAKATCNNNTVNKNKNLHNDSTKITDIHATSGNRIIIENDVEIIVIDDEVSEENSKVDTSVTDPPIAIATVCTRTPLVEVPIQISKVNDNVIQESTDNKKTEISPNKGGDKDVQSNSKNTANALMQLKLFLLECNRKLREKCNFFYVSDIINPSDIVDAVFNIEKANTRYLYQVKHFISEYRSYKQIGYRTLMSAEFNLDMLYKVFKDNEDVERIVISSNLGLDEQSLKKRNIKVIDNKSRNSRHIQVNADSDIFKRMIEKHSCIPKLAEYMDECMRMGKPVVLKGPIKECHVMLVTENVLSLTATASRRQIGKLHPRFVNSPDDQLKPAIAQLRRHLKSLNFGKLRVNDKLIVGENFGKDSSFQRDQVEKLARSLGIEGTLRKFFDKLEFIECEKNIEYHVLQELGPKFELIQSDDHIRVVKEELFAGLRRGGDQAGLFRAIESKILSCDLKNYQQKKNVARIELEFESNRLESLKMVLVQSNKSTIVIKSDYPSLCALKVQQVVKGLEKYGEGRYFFLDMDDLLSAKDNLLNVFRTQLEHVLVVQAEDADLKSEEVTDCLKYIRGSIANDIKRTNKIVLIQNINDKSFDFYMDVIEHREMFNNEAGLTQDFQEKLSETQCEFYGPDCANRATVLKELILQPCDLTDILTSVQCVDKLVKGKVIIGETLIKPIIFESTYTVARRLKRHVVISSAALKEESQDTFFLFGDDKEPKLSKVHYFKDLNSALSSFEQFVSQNKKLNAHLLKCVSVRDSHQLVWQRSSRSISSLRRYVVETREAAGQSDPIDDVLACRIMIICDKSGAGKSHYLYELAHRLQASNQNMENWVVQLNLKDSMLEHHAQCTLNSPDEAVDLLLKMLGYDELQRRMFRLSAFGRLKVKLSLFVDGLEKLRESNVHRWFQILHLLRETNISRIYVTTRLEYRKALEQTLDDFAYSLDSLTQDEQRNFLVNTWFALANQGGLQYNWHSFVDEIFIVKELLNIINEPLYLHIFALVFWHYMKDGQKLPLMPQVYHIYTEYIDKFRNHLTRTRKEIFDKSFPYLSLKRLLHPSDFRKLNLPEVLQSEDFDKLNHSSFAEYGAAKWLASLPLQQQLRAFNAIEDLAERTSIVFTETLFMNNCSEFYMEYIEHIGDNRLVIQLFLRHVWSHADNTKKQEYLKEAVRTNRVRLVCELMLLSSCDVKLSTDFLERITVHVIWTLVDQRSNALHPYWPLVEKLMQLVPQAAARIDSEMQLPRLLAYFFARGRHEIVSKVLKSLNDHNKEQSILHTRVDGLTPLDIVNSSALMSDEQRLATSKFLIERVDSRKNVHSVMTAAARHGHARCLEYFAGKSSEMRSNFLTNAIKTNQLDVLRFLLNDSQWTRDYNQAKNYPLHTAMAEGVSLKTLDFLLSFGGINNRNANGETALSIAIKAGTDLRIIKLLVEKEADVNVKDKLGLRPWCYAVLQKWSRYSPDQQLELMRFLKEKNASPKLPHPDDFQLTYWFKELERKLEYLWNPESFDFNCSDATPRLHRALREQDLVWFNFLLQHGADPDVVDSRKNTALHLAVTMENDQDVLDTVRLLLRHGATFNGLDSNRKTPFDLIRSSENSADKKGEACRLLRQARDLFNDRKYLDQLKKDMTVKDSFAAQSTTLYWLLHCRDARGRTLLHRAAEKNFSPTEIDKLLIFEDRHGNKEGRRSSWLDTRDHNGDTVVHVVARLGNHRLLREFTRRGASLKARNLKFAVPRDLVTDPVNKEFLKKATELFAAVESGLPGALQGVLRKSHSSLVKARDEAGRTLLHLAASGRGSATRDLLCGWRANAHAVDFAGRTPLHSALMADNLESTKLLLKVGASVDARDRSGKQPADLGKPEYRSVQLVNSLSHLLERCWRAKLSAAELAATVETLCKKFDLEPSTVVNARDCTRNTMAHYAVRNHEPELLGALLRRGAVYNVRNAAQETPVDLADGELKQLLGAVDDVFKNPGVAAWEAKKDAVDLDVIINCRKAGGYTLLHTVLQDKKMEEAKWLLDRGADINVTNCFGAPAIKLTDGKNCEILKDTEIYI